MLVLHYPRQPQSTRKPAVADNSRYASTIKKRCAVYLKTGMNVLGFYRAAQKRSSKLLSIPSPNINWFLNFFNTGRKFVIVHVNKYTTTYKVRLYTRLPWPDMVRKCVKHKFVKSINIISVMIWTRVWNLIFGPSFTTVHRHHEYSWCLCDSIVSLCLQTPEVYLILTI